MSSLCVERMQGTRDRPYIGTILWADQSRTLQGQKYDEPYNEPSEGQYVFQYATETDSNDVELTIYR